MGHCVVSFPFLSHLFPIPYHAEVTSSTIMLDQSKTKTITPLPKATGDKAAKQDAASAKFDSVMSALSEIKKKYGEGSIMRMGDVPMTAIPRVSSGSLALDIALGGGVPLGRIIEIYGPESSGKTTLALHCISQVQKKGGRAAFIDAEHALDVSYAKKIGVDVDQLSSRSRMTASRRSKFVRRSYVARELMLLL